jgi:hypothetical protein
MLMSRLKLRIAQARATLKLNQARRDLYRKQQEVRAAHARFIAAEEAAKGFKEDAA